MTEQIQRKLSESKTARWSVLALVAFTMLCGYFITDMMAPLQDSTNPRRRRRTGMDSQ